MKTDIKKDSRGGDRKGAGAKKKYNEQTVTVSFRCPLSKVDDIKGLINQRLNRWSVK